MTNYEFIKSLSIHEMAKVACKVTACCECPVSKRCDGEPAGFLEWLDSEA